MSTLDIPLLCRKSKIVFLSHRFLFPDLELQLTISGSNYPYLESNFHGPKDVRAIEVRLYLKD